MGSNSEWPIRLRPRPFLSAAPGKSLARSDRTTGFRLSLSRLERARHRRVLRAQRRRRGFWTTSSESWSSSTTTPRSASISAPRCFPGWRTKRPQSLRGDSSRRTRPARSASAARLGDRARLQPHDHAAGEPARQESRKSSGASRISSIASGASRKACGCRKRPSTSKRSKCWRKTASNSRFSRRARPSACAARDSRNWKDVSGRTHRSQPGLRRAASLAKDDQRLFLRWADFAGAWRLKAC